MVKGGTANGGGNSRRARDDDDDAEEHTGNGNGNGSGDGAGPSRLPQNGNGNNNGHSNNGVSTHKKAKTGSRHHPSEYIPGAVMKVKLHNFMTYGDVVRRATATS